MIQYSKQDLENIYSGGECGSLAIFLSEKFDVQIWEISGTKNWDDSNIPRSPYHFFIEKDNLFFDIYGWHFSIQILISNFVDFTSECNLQAKKRTPKYVKKHLQPYPVSKSQIQIDWDNTISKIWFNSPINYSPYDGRIVPCYINRSWFYNLFRIK